MREGKIGILDSITLFSHRRILQTGEKIERGKNQGFEVLI
ncbi:hypothetical protein RINTHM_5460 [Richelia intracellularis HM01]|nr:hypothetical protein RINTHM_5460 [Richelia intracellularis HM01]